MREGIDMLAVLSLFLLSVPVSIAAFVIYRWAKPKSPPHHRRFFWAGAIVPFLFFIMLLPGIIPGVGLGVVWCLVVVWLLVCWAASSVQRRVMQFEPQMRKIITILLFSAFLVFPLIYTFVLPQMERDAIAREAERQVKGRVELLARAEKGNAKAQYNLAQMLAKGEDNIRQDFPEAAKWYRKAAEQGDTDAQAALGRLYANGNGVPQDDNEAYFWLSVAMAGTSEDNKGWIKTLLENTEIYMDKAEVKAAKKRAAEWKPAKAK